MTSLPAECQKWRRWFDRQLPEIPEVSAEARAECSAEAAEEPHHTASCPACRAYREQILATDTALRYAFRFLAEERVAAPSADDLQSILARVRSTPETSRLLRRVRRPVNTILWLSILASSLAVLAGLAWSVYWLLRRIG